MGKHLEASVAEADVVANLATVAGRHRLASDVIDELMQVLAEEPRIVLCDLSGMACSPRALDEVLVPVTSYLSQWPGTVVVLCAADPEAYARIVPAAAGGHLLVHASPEAGVAAAGTMLHPLQRTRTHLAPVTAAARDARVVTTRVLHGWRLPQLVDAARLVVSELVTYSIEHSATVVDLTLTRVDDRVRIGVGDHGGGRPTLPAVGAAPELPEGRGLQVVQALTRSWGVFPTRVPGRAVWAVLDASSTAR